MRHRLLRINGLSVAEVGEQVAAQVAEVGGTY